MGWFSHCHRTDQKPIEELRANVQALLEDNPALQVFASDACLTR